jgi:hypothetical protein
MYRHLLSIILCLGVATPAVFMTDVPAAYAAMKKKKKKTAKKHSSKHTSSRSTTSDDEERATRKPRGESSSVAGSASSGGATAAGAGAGAAAQLVLSPRVVDEANRALTIAQQICLVGSEVKFGIDAKGGLNMSRRTPTGNISASFNALQAQGAVIFQDEQIRKVMQTETMNCMIAQWPSVFDKLKNAKGQ